MFPAYSCTTKYHIPRSVVHSTATRTRAMDLEGATIRGCLSSYTLQPVTVLSCLFGFVVNDLSAIFKVSEASLETRPMIVTYC